jgi:hypothetical protein
MTPSILPNRESGPQNQPKAKVAVSVLTGLLASIDGIDLGIITLPSLTFAVLLQPDADATMETTNTRTTANIVFIFSPISQ